MKLIKICIPISLLLLLCNCKTKDKFNELIIKPESLNFKKYDLFNDKNYLLTLTTFDTTKSYNINRPTVILNLFKKNKHNIDTLVNDSLFSRNPIGAVSEIKVEFKDFNFDGIKDIAIPAGADPRGNNGFHLYLVDNINKRIKYVSGFNNIGNPKADSTYKIIQSFVLAGPPFCKFYDINAKNELIDLGHYLEFRDFDSIDSKIQREMQKIKTLR
jgi:hypothetical protein